MSGTAHLTGILPLLLPTALLVGGCTEIQIMAPTGDLVIANSVESGDFVTGVGISVTPSLRGRQHGGHEKGCMDFNTTYGFVAGMNEHGLSINEHALDLAVFQQPSGSMPSLCKGDLGDWALGLHVTVAEVAAALATVRVVGSPGGQWGLQDATGQSIVIEYVKGELRVHNNTVHPDNSGIGLMTNDPTWDWHLQNVNNYAALQPGWYASNNDAIKRKVPDEARYPWATNAYNADAPMVPEPIGHAYNLLGLPGDGSPPARFIRSFYLRGYALQSAPLKTLNDTLVLGQELLNSVYKTLGTIPGRSPLDPIETTPYCTLKVTSPTTHWVMYRSRTDMLWRKIDLSKLDFGPAAVKKTVAVASGSFGFVDVTDQLL